MDYLTGSGMGERGMVTLAENETNQTVTCQQLKEEGIPLPISMTTANALRYSQAFFYLTSLPAAASLDLFVIFIIIRFKKLHNITFYLSLQIIAADLANALVFFPSSAVNAISNRLVFKGLCTLLGFTISFLFAARNSLMFVLVVDRFCLIYMPFWYARHRARLALSLSLGAWVSSLAHALLPISGLPLDCYQFVRFSWNCFIADGCLNKTACRVYRALTLTLFTGGVIVAFLLYLAMLCKAKKLHNKVQVSQRQDSPTHQNILNRNQQIERRANITFLLLFVTLIVLLVPGHIYFLTGSIVISALGVDQPPAFTVGGAFMLSLYYLIFIMDPVIIMRNHDVKEVVKVMSRSCFRRKKHTQHSTSKTASPDN